MNRRFYSLFAIAALCMAGFVGCDRSTTVKTEETVSTPEGTTTTTIEKTVESTGDNPPSSTTGEKVP